MNAVEIKHSAVFWNGWQYILSQLIIGYLLVIYVKKKIEEGVEQLTLN